MANTRDKPYGEHRDNQYAYASYSDVVEMMTPMKQPIRLRQWHRDPIRPMEHNDPYEQYSEHHGQNHYIFIGILRTTW